MQPLLLFWRGNADILATPSAAVIGATEAGIQAVGLTGDLTTLLAEEGLAVVSGLGKGVGQAALGAALSAEGGQSIGVLPMGIEAFSRLPDRMGAMTDAVQQGRLLLLSPFHPEAKFSEAQAVARNKLLVGLSDALFIVTAGQEGIVRETAEDALRLGKAVYVWDVDASSDPTAAGNQDLIQSGGLPITGLADILEAVEAVVTTRLELGEGLQPPPLPPSSPAIQAAETEAPYDPRAVLDLLAKAGRVPEALARRLRQAQEDQ
jgi:predicted Rossmann fold nucleotide-binding protein DprA/Smf involved in DNA uptake